MPLLILIILGVIGSANITTGIFRGLYFVVLGAFKVTLFLILLYFVIEFMRGYNGY